MTAVVRCRNCKGLHWTAQCPLAALEQASQPVEPASAPPPPLKTTVLLDNLTEDATQADVRELCNAIAGVRSVFLKRGRAKITFQTEQGAARAVQALNGHRYDYLVLSAQLED